MHMICVLPSRLVEKGSFVVSSLHRGQNALGQCNKVPLSRYIFHHHNGTTRNEGINDTRQIRWKKKEQKKEKKKKKKQTKRSKREQKPSTKQPLNQPLRNNRCMYQQSAQEKIEKREGEKM